MKKPFDRIIIVMFENQYRSYVIQDPFFKKNWPPREPT